MRPGFFAAPVGLLEAPMFPIADRAGLDESDCPLVLLPQIEITVGTNQRTFTQFVLFLPARRAGPEVLAGPSFTVGIAIDRIANSDHAAVVVAHDLVRIKLLRREPALREGHFEQVAPGPITGSDINKVISANR